MTHYPFFMTRRKIEVPEIWDFVFTDSQVSLDEIELSGLRYTDHLPVPGCYDACEKFAGKKGIGVYRTFFHSSSHEALRLSVGAMGLACRILCDAREIGTSRLPFTPMKFDFNVEPGRHELLIAVDNRCDDKNIPQFQLNCDFYVYGGIYRSLELMEQPGFRFERVTVRTLDYENGTVELIFRFGGDIPAETVVEVAFDQGGFKNFELAVSESEARLQLHVPGHKTWSPEQPDLHLLYCRMPGDAICERFGIREIRVEGPHILLNGKNLKLLGFNRHEHHPDFGYAVPGAVQVNDLMLMKDLGCNFIRGSHYPQDQSFLDRCDECGMLVWEEGLAWGKNTPEQLLDPVFLKSQEENITAMIRESINHPSVILWGFLNECASWFEETRPCYEKLAALVRRLDPARPLSFAVVQSRNHRVFEYADVVAMNCYPGWYDTEDENIRPLDNIRPFIEDTLDYLANDPGSRGKPFIISEIGAAAIYGWHDRFHARWTEEYQADFHHEVCRTVCENERIAGVALWMFCDTRTGMQGRILSRPRGYNNKGVFDEYRRPKEASKTMRSFWGNA